MVYLNATLDVLSFKLTNIIIYINAHFLISFFLPLRSCFNAGYIH